MDRAWSTSLLRIKARRLARSVAAATRARAPAPTSVIQFAIDDLPRRLGPQNRNAPSSWWLFRSQRLSKLNAQSSARGSDRGEEPTIIMITAMAGITTALSLVKTMPVAANSSGVQY
jgi:hypothetical protein